MSETTTPNSGNPLPSSLEEKRKSFETGRYLEHWMFVHELKALLAKLKDDDWLTPNEVHNLVINREGFDSYGIIDFLNNEIDWFGKDPDAKAS